jgi:two-component system, LytTR family, sensor histidine kinase AlgZ
LHPILTSVQRLALYLTSWTLIAVLLASSYSIAAGAGVFEAIVAVVPLCLVYAFVCLSAWYVCRATPLRERSLLQISLTHLGSSVLAATLWIALWEIWTQLLATSLALEQAVTHYRSQLPLILAAGVLLFWLASMFHYLLIVFETSRQAETRELGLEVLAREAELKALRAQIDPHFLFNSLHSISALTTADPAGARRMCLLLADFFRSSVQLSSRDRISLDEEIAMVRQYLDIEKVRFGARLSTEITVDSHCSSCMVPPLLLQPLVENSVRHGIHSVIDGGAVQIAATCGSGRLNLSVQNPADKDAPKREGASLGLRNVRMRLKTLFGNEAAVQVTQQDQSFRVEIQLPCGRTAS